MQMNREKALEDAPLQDLLAILLRQYRQLLAQHDVALTEADIRLLALRLAEGTLPEADALPIRLALITLVEESEQVLARWSLTFEQALKTDMADMPGWETTAEFLELATEKGNAELRIASASALIAALGDMRYAGHLLAAVDHDPHEIETVVARRVLSQACGVNPRAGNWQERIEGYLRRVYS